MSQFIGLLKLATWVLLAVLAVPVAVNQAADAHPSRRMDATASWYGWSQTGRLMANGKPFRPLALTAASRSIPLGSRVRITRHDTGRAVMVTITDRGPYRSGRDVDVSLGVARRLGMVGMGLARVRMEILR